MHCSKCEQEFPSNFLKPLFIGGITYHLCASCYKYTKTSQVTETNQSATAFSPLMSEE